MAVISHFCFDGRDWQGCLQVGRGQRLLTIMERTSLSYFQEESAVLFSFVKRSTHSQKETHTQGRTQRNTCTHTHIWAHKHSRTQSRARSRTHSRTHKDPMRHRNRSTHAYPRTHLRQDRQGITYRQRNSNTPLHKKKQISSSVFVTRLDDNNSKKRGRSCRAAQSNSTSRTLEFAPSSLYAGRGFLAASGTIPQRHYSLHLHAATIALINSIFGRRCRRVDDLLVLSLA